jgi:hypothetical protein
MKKIFVLFLSLVVFAACSVSVDKPSGNNDESSVEIEERESNDISESKSVDSNHSTWKIGDKIGAFTLKEIGGDQVVDSYFFEGELNLTGSYFYDDNAAYPQDSICMYDLDKESSAKIPRLLDGPTMIGAKYFCFDSDEKITAQFGGKNSQGRATAMINGYIAIFMKGATGGVVESADFGKVVKIHTKIDSLDEKWNLLTGVDGVYSMKVPKKMSWRANLGGQDMDLVAFNSR